LLPTPYRIIFVPGLKPKPEPDVHRRELARVLTAGVARVWPDAARRLAAEPERFTLVAWTYRFYGSHRDIALDLPGIERLLAQPVPSAEDIREIGALRWRALRLWHVIGDVWPPLGRFVARPAMRLTMHEANRYLKNHDDIASAIRGLLRDALIRAWDARERVLLVGHSLGSVIAYDTLWDLSHGTQRRDGRVDLLITMGSPLATQFIRRSLLGAKAATQRRYPSNIGRWLNFSAKADMTALRPRLAPFFREMIDLKLVESIEDEVGLENHFRGSIGLNVHEAYGYLAHSSVAAAIGEWLMAR
jgi:pimeloyl-ACP methyl ester carboxylesterase